MPRSILPAALALPALFGLASCGTGSPPVPPAGAAAGRAAPVTYGVVVTIRPLPAPGDRTGTILGAVGSGPAPGQPASFEFILREDDGRTLSVVQTNAEGLRPGERIVVSMGERTLVGRAGD
jgi:outer membrane lipoprotein SlyB